MNVVCYGVDVTHFLRFTGTAGRAIVSETAAYPMPARPPTPKRTRTLLWGEPACPVLTVSHHWWVVGASPRLSRPAV